MRIGCGPGLTVLRTRVGELASLARSREPGDLLIAIAAGSRAQQDLLPAGIAGDGFDGNLTSASTRTDGVVVTTDIAPTVLEHLGVEVPDEVNGSEIEAAGDRDPGDVADLQARLDHRPSRDTVVLLPAGDLAGADRRSPRWSGAGAGRGVALRLLALSGAWAPLLLLLLAAPDAGPARLGALGRPRRAAARARHRPAARRCAGRWRSPAALTVAAYAVDVIAGSPLTSLSVLGPNPGAGVRFFGIGNELEAILTTLTLIGTGAWLETRREGRARPPASGGAGSSASRSPPPPPSRPAASAPTSAPRSCSGSARRPRRCSRSGSSGGGRSLIVAGGGAPALAALFVVDLVLGGAHLSRSVLGAGEAGDVVDVLDRRLTLMARHVHRSRLSRAARRLRVPC